MEWISIAIFLAGMGFGMVVLRILYYYFGEPPAAMVRMTKEELMEFINGDVGDVFDEATLAEMFEDLEEDDEDE